MQQIRSPKAATLGGTAGSIFPTRHLGTACQGCKVQVGTLLGRLTACLTAPSSNQAPDPPAVAPAAASCLCCC